MSPKTTPSAAKLKPATPIAEAGLRFSAEILITRISMDHSITAQRLSLILVRRTSDAEEPDHRHRRLLRARREWPRDSRAPEQRDELVSRQDHCLRQPDHGPGVRPQAGRVPLTNRTIQIRKHAPMKPAIR